MINVLVSISRARPRLVQVPAGTADIKTHLENRFPGDSVVIMKIYGQHQSQEQKNHER